VELPRPVAAEGERRLMAALLEDAIGCFQKNVFARDKRSRDLFEEATEWIMEEDTGAAFSFLHICDTLGLDPGYIRTGLQEWCDRQMGDARATHRTGAPGRADGELQVDRGRGAASPLKEASGE
jgi:hypothetical protein